MPNYKRYVTIFIAFFVISIISKIFLGMLPDILWFSNLGYLQVFFTPLITKIGLWFIGFIVSFLIIYINLIAAKNFFVKFSAANSINNIVKTLKNMFDLNIDSKIIDISPKKNNKFINWGVIIFTILVSWGTATTLSMNWLTVLSFFKQLSFNIADPLFNKDIGFYIFSLPFIKLIFKLSGTILFFSAIGSIFFYFLSGHLKIQDSLNAFIKKHISILGFLASCWILLGIIISKFNLLYSSRGVVFGASYTDIHGELLSLNVLTYGMIALIILFLVNIFLRGLRAPIIGSAVIILITVILGGLYPAILQKFVVKPNEITKEEPFIKHNIKYTQLAYDLNNIEAHDFHYQKEISLTDLRKNQEILSNIRLWDPRPLKKTYSQLQEIRLYYDFHDVDVDRYIINGKPTQVMISAREMNITQLPPRAKTWVNEKLKYTHGYGIVANNVHTITEEGLPDFLIKNIPPQSTAINITQPEIYYGEKTNDYVIVNTKTKEFDYPKGDENAYTTYQGKGDIKFDKFYKRLIYALKFSDLKLLISGYITKDSKLLYNRNIAERIKKIAPFLYYDSDPYVVISDDGKIYYIQDAYTISNKYPYAEPYRKNINYIRNSVKIVVDAYNGDVTFYNMGNDPIANVYQAILPDLFKPISDFPTSIKDHIRYPLDLFYIQAQMYRTYHMSNPQVFYNLEDMWAIPTETYEKDKITMEPYYLYSKLPGEEKLSYILMIPFTPSRKDNLISWLAVKCGPEDYGKMYLYKLPKKELIYGPMQIESRIDQEAEISKELTLWSQEGSSVIRGNMLLIPIGKTFIYVEPIYLLATTSQLPELKRIIISSGDKITMQQNFGRSLSTILSMKAISAVTSKVKKTLSQLANDALILYNKAETALQEGSWGKYGENQKKLKSTLQEMTK